MNALFKSLNNLTLTENSREAYKSTLNSVLDLFSVVGTARGCSVMKEFLAAYKANPELTIRVLLWARDIRGGAGERQRFRDLLLVLFELGIDDEIAEGIANKIPEVGRYDDLFIYMNTKYEKIALSVLAEAIGVGKNGLAAKWAPRKGPIATKLRRHMELGPKEYRRTVVDLTTVVEQLMCASKWDEINYSHVPSQASRIYSKAFRKHDTDRYNKYLEEALRGKVKMNAGAIFPYEIYRQAYRGNEDQADAQWKNLPNYLEGTDEQILVVADVSGSMRGPPMEMSVSLGLYFSERLTGEFKDHVITFSEYPSFVTLNSDLTLSKRIKQLERIDWGGSTNIDRVFTLLLGKAVELEIPQSDMPTKLLIISDMQFDCASGNEPAYQSIRAEYEKNGYTAPQLVFWNVAASNYGNVPVTMNENGVGLISGASPAAVKAVLGIDIDPISIMLSAIMVDRYKL